MADDLNLDDPDLIERVRRSRADQGLALAITDPAVIAKLRTLLRPDMPQNSPETAQDGR
jgi:hypothetical protein